MAILRTHNNTIKNAKWSEMSIVALFHDNGQNHNSGPNKNSGYFYETPKNAILNVEWATNYNSGNVLQ